MDKNRLLVVEDAILTARDIESSLVDMGYEVCGTAMSGEEAIRKAREERPDLVLMDIILRGDMDGIEAASLIREEQRTPIVFISAFTDEEKLNRAKLAEPFGYLVKPFGDRELRSAVEMALYKAEMDKRMEQNEERFRTVADFTYDWEWWMAPDGEYLYISPSCQRITGYSREEFLKDPELLQRIIHPEDRDKFIEEMERHLESEDLETLHFRIKTRSGEERWIAHFSQRVQNSEGEDLGRRASNRDITKRRKVEQERERLIAELQDALAEVKTLQGFLPICANCKKIRDDEGYWQQIEKYIQDRSDARFSHSICPDCGQKLYPEFYQEDRED
jgi:PAS domain S-box-containing protein